MTSDVMLVKQWEDSPDKKAARKLEAAHKWAERALQGMAGGSIPDDAKAYKHFRTIYKSDDPADKDLITQLLKTKKAAISLFLFCEDGLLMRAIEDQTRLDQIEILCNGDEPKSENLVSLICSQEYIEDMHAPGNKVKKDPERFAKDTTRLLHNYTQDRQKQVLLHSFNANSLISHGAGEEIYKIVKDWELNDQKDFLCKYGVAGGFAKARLGYLVFDMLDRQKTDDDRRDILTSRWFVYDMAKENYDCVADVKGNGRARWDYGEEIAAEVRELSSSYKKDVFLTMGAIDHIAENHRKEFLEILFSMDEVDQRALLDDKEILKKLRNLGYDIEIYSRDIDTQICDL